MSKLSICKDLLTLRETLARVRERGSRIGFVPTMGALHEGHASLVREAKAAGQFTVVSIFVNPLQFGPHEDFARYPRSLERDMDVLGACGADCLLLPSIEVMYPQGFATHIDIPVMSEVLCGASRPGHFRGVLTVVVKLLSMVRPDTAYFGQKDLQQAALIKRMVTDLNLDIEIKRCPIVRDADGLALSSRNVYLSSEEREAALSLSRALRDGVARYRGGERSAASLIARTRATLAAQKLLRIDYVAVVDADTMLGVATMADNSALALAVFVGKTRLIDNAMLAVDFDHA